MTSQEAIAVDVAALATLLHETSERHGPYEASAPEHHWWDWYAAYMVACENSRTPDEASADAAHHMESLLK